MLCESFVLQSSLLQDNSPIWCGVWFRVYCLKSKNHFCQRFISLCFSSSLALIFTVFTIALFLFCLFVKIFTPCKTWQVADRMVATQKHFDLDTTVLQTCIHDAVTSLIHCFTISQASEATMFLQFARFLGDSVSIRFQSDFNFNMFLRSKFPARWMVYIA